MGLFTAVGCNTKSSSIMAGNLSNGEYMEGEVMSGGVKWIHEGHECYDWCMCVDTEMQKSSEDEINILGFSLLMDSLILMRTKQVPVNFRDRIDKSNVTHGYEESLLVNSLCLILSGWSSVWWDRKL